MASGFLSDGLQDKGRWPSGGPSTGDVRPDAHITRIRHAAKLRAGRTAGTMRTHAPIPLAALFVVLTAGCSGESPLPVSYSVLTGEQIREAVRSQKGKVVVLNLWATWCVPCRQEFPALVSLDETHRSRGVRVIGVSVDDVEDIDGKIRPFVDASGARFPIWVKAVGDPMDFIAALSPQVSGAIPETLIYDRKRDLVRVVSGEQTLEEFEAAIRPLL